MLPPKNEISRTLSRPITDHDMGGQVSKAAAHTPFLTYLACPYTHHSPELMEWRYEMATRAAAFLIKTLAWNVFSPITHSHPLSKVGCRSDWASWKKFDTEYLQCSTQVVVLLLKGWASSTGVREELGIAAQLGLNVRFLIPTSPTDFEFLSGRADPYSVIPYDIPIAETLKCQDSKCENPEPPCSVPFELRGCSKVPEGMDNPKDLIGMTKPPLRLVPGALLLHCARVMALGAKKYGPYNWREKAVRYTVYLEAAMRHLISALDGEEIDPESGEPHTAHVASCMGIILDAKSLGKLINDLPIPGKSAELIKQMTDKK